MKSLLRLSLLVLFLFTAPLAANAERGECQSQTIVITANTTLTAVDLDCAQTLIVIDPPNVVLTLPGASLVAGTRIVIQTRFSSRLYQGLGGCGFLGEENLKYNGLRVEAGLLEFVAFPLVGAIPGHWAQIGGSTLVDDGEAPLCGLL